VWEWSDTLLIQADFSDEFWRYIASGVQQMVELSELLANRALDIVDPR